MIELRKRKIEADMESGTETPALFKILPEKPITIGASMMGSSKVYDLSAAKKVNPLHDHDVLSSTGIDLTLNPEELEMDGETLKSKYNQFKDKATDLEDQDENERQTKKRKQQKISGTLSGTISGTASFASQEKEKTKKYKEFKF
jgi:splicing factor 3B subunit 2